MAGKSGISWTEATWNPYVGCSKISPGCDSCYAERMANRLQHNPKVQYPEVVGKDGKWLGVAKMRHKAMADPLMWKEPRLIFVSSMGDLFHKTIPDYQRNKVFRVMWDTRDRHTYLLLTKRPWIMQKYLQNFSMLDTPPWPWPHVWIGVTAENQATADVRLPMLVRTPAFGRFVSVEPMLGYVDLSQYATEIDWVIAGCESGPGRRPADDAWFRDLREQCSITHVPYFLKQREIDREVVKEPYLDGKKWLQFPQFRKMEVVT